MTKLTDADIEAALTELPGWSYEEGHLLKEFKFKGFKSAVAFIVRISFEAEAMKHHPDIENHYNRVIVSLRTWDEDGVTDKDVDLARRIESAAA